IEFETADLKRFAWTADKSGYVCPRGEWLKQQIALLPKREGVKITRGVEIGGTVPEEGGKPLAGAEILFDRPLNMILEESVYPIHSRKWTTRSGERLAVSDATGTWRAKRLYPKIQWASLRVRHPDFTEA